jgi:hypothetical protein
MAFHPGDRVDLVATDDPYTRLRPGDQGTVTGVRDFPEPTIDVQWDNGSILSILPGAGDHISKLPGDPTSSHTDPASGPPTTTSPTAWQAGAPADPRGQPAAQRAAPPCPSCGWVPPLS